MFRILGSRQGAEVLLRAALGPKNEGGCVCPLRRRRYRLNQPCAAYAIFSPVTLEGSAFLSTSVWLYVLPFSDQLEWLLILYPCRCFGKASSLTR